MDVAGSNVLVLGGAGLVGRAVCRELLAEKPACLVVAARRERRAREAVAALRREHPDAVTDIVPAWGDVFLRADWQAKGGGARAAVLEDAARRARLVDDILAPLDEGIVGASCLVQLIAGDPRADIVVDCMNTATAVSYQNVYAEASRMRALAASGASDTDWSAAVERLLAMLYLPQLVRHVQLLSEGMRRAGTRAYVKVGTTGSGGFGFNIPYTHGEEKPSRLLLAKSAVAGAQAMLTFLMGRTPNGPEVVKLVSPAACIGWRAIGHGPIRRHGREFERWDCPPELAVPAHDPASLAREGDFGEPTGLPLEGVFIDTGENGVFTADEFEAITAPGQMQLVTAEEIAVNVVRELLGASTGREMVAALDASVMGPSHRGGHLRSAALEQLRRLEAEHGPAVAFEILGPPRLSKLLFEAHLLARCCESLSGVIERAADTLSSHLEREVVEDADLRQRILSIGIPILLPDGERLLRGPVIKADTPEQGWVDLGVANVRRWQQRAVAMREAIRAEGAGESSSRHDRLFRGVGDARQVDALVPGEAVAWILIHEERGRRGKT